MSPAAQPPVARPEIVHEPVSASAFGIVEKPLSTWERISQSPERTDYVVFAGSVAAERGAQAPERYGRLIRRAD